MKSETRHKKTQVFRNISKLKNKTLFYSVLFFSLVDMF